MGVLRVEISDETEAVFHMELLRRKGAEKKHVESSNLLPQPPLHPHAKNAILYRSSGFPRKTRTLRC